MLKFVCFVTTLSESTHMARPALFILALMLSLTTLAPTFVGLANVPVDRAEHRGLAHEEDNLAHGTSHGHRHNHSGCSLTMAAAPVDLASICKTPDQYRKFIRTVMIPCPYLKQNDRPPIA